MGDWLLIVVIVMTVGAGEYGAGVSVDIEPIPFQSEALCRMAGPEIEGLIRSTMPQQGRRADAQNIEWACIRIAPTQEKK